VHQACAEARAEAEAAAEQRVATALALERAELDKQARSLLCMCGNRHVRSTLPWPVLVHCVCKAAWSRCTCHARGGMEQKIEMSCSVWKRPSCS